VSLAVFIAAQRAQYGVPHAVSCRALGVSQAWFYKWRRGDVSLRRKRRAAIDAAVAYQFARRSGRDGSPVLTQRLAVADSMRRQGLVARPKRKRRGLTRADRRARKAPDLLRRDFAPPQRIDQRWVSDLTEIPTAAGKLYLASILDLASRRAVGYALGEHHDADLAAASVQVAIAVRGGDVAGVVLHTDQGGEFTSGALTRVCAAAGITPSMGRTGSALDNAVSESFHSTLEFELLSRTRFATHAHAKAAVVTRRPYGPPLTPEPLRARAGTPNGRPRPAPATARRHQANIHRRGPLQDHTSWSLYGFRGLPESLDALGEKPDRLIPTVDQHPALSFQLSNGVFGGDRKPPWQLDQNILPIRAVASS
jgi:putative transposase